MKLSELHFAVKTKKACFIPNSNIKSLAEETQKNVKPGRNQQSHLSWVESPSPTRTGLSYRSHMAGGAPNEWRSRLFKPCFSTCPSGALHLLKWPGPGCHTPPPFAEASGSLSEERRSGAQHVCHCCQRALSPAASSPASSSRAASWSGFGLLEVGVPSQSGPSLGRVACILHRMWQSPVTGGCDS